LTKDEKYGLILTWQKATDTTRKGGVNDFHNYNKDCRQGTLPRANC
jgi:hypothetical protein